jgi:hypothetical protein
MTQKMAKVTSPAAFQYLKGWENGKPTIDKLTPVQKIQKTNPPKQVKVDDVAIDSTAGEKYYWMVGTQYYIKKIDVTF